MEYSGGDKRDRTVDPLLAKQVLSQLSYTPVRDRTGLFYNADTSFDASASQTLRFALAASFNVQTFVMVSFRNRRLDKYSAIPIEFPFPDSQN